MSGSRYPNIEKAGPAVCVSQRGKIMKTDKKRWIMAVAGFLLAAMAELALAWYGAGRGYGMEDRGMDMQPETIRDYEITDGRWIVSGDLPAILFQSDQDLGHIHISLKEPLESDTSVFLYYTENPEDNFDRFSRKERYMMAGTREADLSVPPGNWRKFQFEIRGDFVPNQLQIIPAVSAADIHAEQVIGQIKPLRFLGLGIVLAVWFYLCSEDRKKSERDKKKSEKDRQVWLDLVRTIAAVFVVILHVTEPVTLILPPGSRLQLLTRWTCVAMFTCNLLFVLISGALLLPYRKEPVGTFVKKRVLSVVLPLMVYAVFYIQGMCITRGTAEMWLRQYFHSLLSAAVTEAPHFWLVYELIGLYLLVLPLRYFLKRLPEKGEKWLALLILILLGARTAFAYAGQPWTMRSFLGGWPGIFLMGYFLTRGWMRKYDGALIGCGAAAYLVSLWLESFRADYKVIVCNQSILMTFMSMAVFVTAMRLNPYLKPLSRFLSVCSSYSYSVLLIHWFVLSNFIYNGWMSSRMPGTVQILLPIAVCLMASWFLSVLTDHLAVNPLNRLLRRLPLRKM